MHTYPCTPWAQAYNTCSSGAHILVYITCSSVLVQPSVHGCRAFPLLCLQVNDTQKLLSAMQGVTGRQFEVGVMSGSDTAPEL
jgi:hypothetical protein